MGRAKLKMELINKEKSRNMTFRRRKDGLLKKMQEFTTLCGVDGCIIIYGPKYDSGPAAEPEIWPDSPEEVRRMVAIYRSKSGDTRTFGLSDFFHDRKRRIEDELAKIRRGNMEARYPTRPDFMSFMSEPELREFVSGLQGKAGYVKSRIELLRRNRDIGHDANMNTNMNNLMDSMVTPQSLDFDSPGARGVEPTILNQQGAVSAHHVNTEMRHHHHVPILNQNSMMTLLMSDNNQLGLGPTSSGDMHCAPYNRQVYYESLGQYYGPTLPLPVLGPVPPPYIVPGMVGSSPGSQLQNMYGIGGGGGDGQEDVINHQYSSIYNRARY